jgi:hypothetical protein
MRAEYNLLLHCGYDAKTGEIEPYLDTILRKVRNIKYTKSRNTPFKSGAKVRRSQPPGVPVRKNPQSDSHRESANLYAGSIQLYADSEEERQLGALKEKAVNSTYREVWDMSGVFPFSAVLFNKVSVLLAIVVAPAAALTHWPYLWFFTSPPPPSC